MLDPGSNRELPEIPAKRYFTIGEVSELCDVKQHVLRYWETEFETLNPVKRRGNRRYYQHHDVLKVRDEIIRQSEESIEELINDPVKNQKAIENAQKNLDNAIEHAKNIHEIILTIKNRPLLWQL